MVREGRVITSTAGRPTFGGASYFVTAYEVGAQVSAGSSGSVIQVRAGHGFEADDKGIVFQEDDASRYFLVGSVTSTTITLAGGGTLSVAAGEYLVNLGLDTGMSAPEYDGSGATVYTDMDYTTEAADSTVLTTDDARYRYFHKGIDIWELVRSDASTPYALYVDADSQVFTEEFANLHATGGSGTSSDPWVGWDAGLAENTVLRFPNGYYEATTDITVPAGATLIGYGTLSRIVFDRSSSSDIGFVNDTDAGDIVMRDLYIDGDGDTASSTNATIQFSSGTGQNYLFQNLYIVDAAHSGIRFVGSSGVSTNVKVLDCSINGAERHGIEFSSDVTNGVISNNYCKATNSVTLGASIYAGSISTATNISVTGNVVDGSLDNGIRSAGNGITISGNTVTGCANDGIRLAGDKQVCSGNVVRGCGGQGIKAEDYENITITGNTCTGNTESGIQVRYTNSQIANVAVTGNNCGLNTLHGIHLRGGQDFVVSGNQCNENAGANIWCEAPDSVTLTRVLVSGNYCFKTTGVKGSILVSATGGVPGTIGTIDIIGNVCEGGTTGVYGIGVLDVGSGVSIIDNISRNHASSANFSLVTGCYLRHSGIGTAANATSAAVNGSMWFQTDAATADMAVSIYENAGWRSVQPTLVTTGITASTTQTQAGGTALKRGVNNVATCANANDTVTLPLAVAGLTCAIFNNGAQTLRIYPGVGDNLGAGVDTLTTLAAGSNLMLVAYDGTNWETI